jgi:CheY-like chemotaxis protein
MLDLNSSSRLTVLLPDEQEEWHHTTRRLLEPLGVQTVAARNGREAVDLIESNAVHVAVLDVQMPQLGGMQVVKRLRELQKGHPQRRTPPAILVANDLTSHLLREALMNHVFSVLSKPVDYSLLLDALARVVKRHYESRWPKFQ